MESQLKPEREPLLSIDNTSSCLKKNQDSSNGSILKKKSLSFQQKEIVAEPNVTKPKRISFDFSQEGNYASSNSNIGVEIDYEEKKDDKFDERTVKTTKRVSFECHASDYDKKAPVATDYELSSSEKYETNLDLKPKKPNDTSSTVVQIEENATKRNRTFSIFKDMFGSLSNELVFVQEETEKIDSTETKEDDDANKNDTLINSIFSKNTGNDLLRFDFVSSHSRRRLGSSLELKPKDLSANLPRQNSIKAMGKKSRETILHMKRMTEIISVADFGKFDQQYLFLSCR